MGYDAVIVRVMRSANKLHTEFVSDVTNGFRSTRGKQGRPT